jgi:hypothetical protein
VPFKAGSEPLQVHSGAAKLLSFKLSPLYAEHKARKEPHHTGRRKALSVPFKAGSEFLPVNSSVVKLLSFKLAPLCAEYKTRKVGSRIEPYHPGTRQGSFCDL